TIASVFCIGSATWSKPLTLPVCCPRTAVPAAAALAAAMVFTNRRRDVLVSMVFTACARPNPQERRRRLTPRPWSVVLADATTQTGSGDGGHVSGNRRIREGSERETVLRQTSAR